MERNSGDETVRVLNPDKRMGFGPNTPYRYNVHYTHTHFYTVCNTHRSDRYDMTLLTIGSTKIHQEALGSRSYTML